ncbi:fungal specific transcription factor domain-containing protein [Aspergillus thermomutatus]|uniref:Xylanolytic transcriptional activator regulatory domain-containing protein n=1 Tax=Aspergillus thermomutatus TaxID=41047 RepID=A0A397GZS8_ASPTH|nr:uncharacterized protein CDV56_106294 [Aspergillus thermomutatus]RHZ53580.1 hypothetical protein CDV56_106294 [Aspergillus thermomutatus]
MLNGMFALSARFSNAPEFIGIDPTCRDQIFVKRATELWETISKDFKHCLRTLPCLQGLILLTFSSLLSGPSEDAWILSGTCVRLAYDLDLHTTDAHRQHEGGSPQQNQEYRFVHVLLPVSDHDWDNRTQAPSALLNANGGMPWKHLTESPNQSERAWFLVCLAVLRQAYDAAVPPGASVERLHHAEAVIGCAFLALPRSFQDLSMSGASWPTSHVTFNWIACSLIVLNWYALCPLQNETLQPADVRPPRIYLSTIIEVNRAARLLSPQHLSLCSPFVCCALVGPSTVHVPDDHILIESQSASLCAETIRLVLSDVARHWSIGGILLDIIDYKKTSKPASPAGRCSQTPFTPEWRALVDDIF